MHTIYEDQSPEAVLLVDTPNLFSSINRKTFLYNINTTLLARHVRNCYYANTRLFVIDGGEIESVEGKMKSDPTAMVI